MPHFGLLAHRAWNPPLSSSLAEGRTPPLAPPPCGGARFPTLAAPAAMGVQPGRSSHCVASQASYALGLSVSTLSVPADFAFSQACSSLTVQTMTMSPAFFSSLT